MSNFDIYTSPSMQSSMPMPSPTPSLGASLGKSLLSNVLGGVASLNPVSMLVNGAGSLISYGLNRLQQKDQNEQQMKMWQMNNEYNSPAAQMERMKDAGINPNLAAAGIAGANNNAQMPAAASANESVGTANNIGSLLGNSFNSGLDARLAEKQIDNAEIEKQVLAQTAIEKGIANENMPTIFKQTINNMKTQGILNETEAKWLDKQASRYDEIVDTDIDKVKKIMAELDAAIRNYNSSTALNIANKNFADAATSGQTLQNAKQSIINEFLEKYHIEPNSIEAATIAAYVEDHTKVKDDGTFYYYDDEGRATTQSRTMLNAIEKVQKHKALGDFEANPENEEFRNQYEYMKWTEQALKDAKDTVARLEGQYEDLKSSYGKRSETALKAYNRLQEAKDVMKEAEKLNKRAGDDWRRGEYKQGYSRLSQDLAKIGVAAGIYTAGSLAGKLIPTPLPPKSTVTSTTEKLGKGASRTSTITRYNRK